MNNGPNTPSRPASAGGPQRRIQEHRRGPRFISGYHPGSTRPPRPGGPPAPRHHGQRARNTRPADPDRRHPADHRPRQARLAPPRRAHRPPPRTILLRLGPACPATASPPRSCGCATRDQPTAGPSGSTWPAAASYTESELPTSFGPKTGTPEEGVDDTFILYAGPKTGHLRPSAASGPRPYEGAKYEQDRHI